MTYEEIKIIENYITAAAIPQSAGKNITENFFYISELSIHI